MHCAEIQALVLLNKSSKFATMLSRICNQSVRFVRLAQLTRSSTSRHSAVTSFVVQSSKYTTAAINVNEPEADGFESILKQMKSEVKKQPEARTDQSSKSRSEVRPQLSLQSLKSTLKQVRSQPVSSTQALELLQSVSQSRLDKGQFDIVKDIWKELKKNNKDFTIEHYNCLLQLSRNKLDAKFAKAVFDDLTAAGLKPDPITYTALLSTYCRLGDIENCLEILKLMDNENMYINGMSFNDVAQCHILCENIEAAEGTIVVLKEKGFHVNHHVLNALLIYYSKLGDIDNIKKTIERFSEEKIDLLNHQIVQSMCELAKHGYGDKIESLTTHLKPNMELSTSFQKIITSFVKDKQSALIPKIMQCIGGDQNQNIKHLVREMVRHSSSETEFNETIENIAAMGITIENNFGLFRSAINSSSVDIIGRVLKQMKSESFQITQTDLIRPLELSAKKGKGLDFVKLMCDDLGQQPQISFVRDTILPALKFKENPSQVMKQLKATNIRPRVVSMATISNSLLNGDFKTAYNIASTYPNFYGIFYVKNSLLAAYKSSDNISDFVQFLRLIHDSFARINEYSSDKKYSEAEIDHQRKAFVDETLFAVVMSKSTDSNHTERILEAFAEEGIAISTSRADLIRAKLKVESDSKIDQLLRKLCSESLTLKPAKEQPKKHVQSNAKSSMISIVDAVASIDSHTASGDLDSALNLMKQIRATYKTFKLNPIKLARVVELMLKKERDFTEIDAVLRDHQNAKTEIRIFIFENVMDELAKSGKVELLEKFIAALIKYNYIQPTVRCMGSLVNVHLANKDFEKAVAKYEELYESHDMTPMTFILFNHLIENNRSELLQRVFDIFEKSKGASTALFRLAMSFCKCGKEQQARLILQNENIKNLSKTLAHECEHLVKYENIASAKTLLKATKGLACNRHCIYQTLLDIYQKENKAQEALDLWWEYSTEDGLTVNRVFQTKLVELLKANNMELPANLEPNQNTSEPDSEK